MSSMAYHSYISFTDRACFSPVKSQEAQEVSIFNALIEYLRLNWIARKGSLYESGKLSYTYTTFWWLMYAWYAIKSIFGYKDLQRVKLCTKLLKKMNSGSLNDEDRDAIMKVMPKGKECAATFTALVTDSLSTPASF